MLHLETNCRSTEPTQPKSPAGEMESDQLSGPYGFSRLTVGKARRSKAGQRGYVYCGLRAAGNEQGQRLLAQLNGAAHGTVPSWDSLTVGDRNGLN